MLDPGRGKTKKAFVWAYARSPLDGPAGVIYDFCVGRGAQYPLAFLGGQGPPYAEAAWRGTLLSDQYAAYYGAAIWMRARDKQDENVAARGWCRR
jgi:hypothetical protein